MRPISVQTSGPASCQAGLVLDSSAYGDGERRAFIDRTIRVSLYLDIFGRRALLYQDHPKTTDLQGHGGAGARAALRSEQDDERPEVSSCYPHELRI